MIAMFSRLLFVNWLQNRLLRCPFKYLTGIDCPGCGFQRAVLALIQGNFHQSIALYPPAIPLILFFIYGIADAIFKLDNSTNTFKKSFFVLTGSIVLVNYAFKLFGLYGHYNASALAMIWL